MLNILPEIIILLALPLVAIGIILTARRLQSTPNLALSLILSGITGAVFTALVVFTLSTTPIAPYETSRNAWYPIFGQCLLSLYIGFGLGVAIAAIVVSPFLLVKALVRKYRLRQMDSASVDKQKSETK